MYTRNTLWHRHTLRCCDGAPRRVSLQPLPQVLWETGGSEPGVSRSILRMLCTAGQDIAAAPSDDEAGARTGLIYL